MKKQIAIVLLLGLILPMVLVNSASGAQAEKLPFYLVNWQNDVKTASDTDYENIYGMPFFDALDYVEGSGSVRIKWSGTYNFSELAKRLKAEFDRWPEGTRFINLQTPIDSVVEPEAMIYLEEGTRLYAEWMENFFSEYKRIGGKLDGVEIDVEYSEIGAYYIHRAYNGYTSSQKNEEGIAIKVPANKNIYNEIVNHPLYATEVRPLLEERGFGFSVPSGQKSEIYGISVSGSKEYEIWDAVMRNRMCQYLNEVCAPVMNYFPEAAVSNYRFPSSKGWQESVGQKGGFSDGGNTNYAGNTANENFYLRRPYTNFYTTTSTYNKPAFYNKAVYEDSPFHSFMFEINTFKDMYESSDNKRISAWIAGFNYHPDVAPANGLYITAYYTETMYHLGMMNPDPFIGYIVGPRDTDKYGYTYADNMKVCSEIMSELTRVAGYADRKAIAVPTQWNSDFVLSGMYAGGRNIWRLTPDISEGTSLAEFKSDDKTPTFSIGGQTVIFPQGKIIADSKVSYIGSCGYWIETPADVTPVIVNDTDRYAENPAYEENFESYADGMAFSRGSALHKNAWETTGALTVKNQGKDKALAMTGNATLKSIKIPENITAGDSYAEQQGWEVSFTAPKYGELKLLSYTYSDGGIKIAGGKVYYDQSGTYQVLPGVTIYAGKTYTIRRELDFRTSGAYKSSYTVYDSDGKRLAGVTGVSGYPVSLPVKKIEISCTNVSDTAYIDDFKLYAAGVAADFTLYDAKTGMQLTGTNLTRTKDTAYRLSWMNASATHATASVYNNGKLVQRVEMEPGADGVITGIVKGNSKLYVTVEQDEPIVEPDEGNQTPTEPVGGGNTNNGATPGGSTQSTVPSNTEPSGSVDVTEPSGSVETTIPSEDVETTNPSDDVPTTNPSFEEDVTNPSYEEDITNPSYEDITNPSDDTAITRPSADKPGQSSEEDDNGIPVGVIAVAVVVLLVGGFALYYFIIKPNRLAKKNNE